MGKPVVSKRLIMRDWIDTDLQCSITLKVPDAKGEKLLA